MFKIRKDYLGIILFEMAIQDLCCKKSFWKYSPFMPQASLNNWNKKWHKFSFRFSFLRYRPEINIAWINPCQWWSELYWKRIPGFLTCVCVYVCVCVCVCVCGCGGGGGGRCHTLKSNLKWKLILLLIFHHQSHIWQISSSQVRTANQIAGFFKM